MTPYKRPTEFGAECHHGQLARSCERCDDREEIDELRALLVEAREFVDICSSVCVLPVRDCAKEWLLKVGEDGSIKS